MTISIISTIYSCLGPIPGFQPPSKYLQIEAFPNSINRENSHNTDTCLIAQIILSTLVGCCQGLFIYDVMLLLL